MKRIVVKKVILLVGAMCFIVPFSYAGNEKKLLSAAKAATANTLPGLERQVARAGLGAQKLITTRTGTYFYHPVFGYIPHLPPIPHKDGAITPFVGHLYDTFKFMRLIQVAPLTQPLQNVHTDKNLAVFEKMTLAQVTQATYLYRLAHPESAQEEHEAADKLLALRQAGEKLPQNPTPRDLLELAYNRLETHSIPYTKINEIYAKDYKAYPNYKNTQLYRTIKGMIKDQRAIEYNDAGYNTLKNVDMTHLIVLDAVMGGVNQENLSEIRRAIDAFGALCAEVHPKDEQAIAHLAVLQKNLRVVFDEMICFNDLQINWASGQDSRRRKAELANYAAAILKQPIRQLVGRNRKPGY